MPGKALFRSAAQPEQGAQSLSCGVLCVKGQGSTLQNLLCLVICCSLGRSGYFFLGLRLGCSLAGFCGLHLCCRISGFCRLSLCCRISGFCRLCFGCGISGFCRLSLCCRISGLCGLYLGCSLAGGDGTPCFSRAFFALAGLFLRKALLADWSGVQGRISYSGRVFSQYLGQNQWRGDSCTSDNDVFILYLVWRVLHLFQSRDSKQ